MHFRSDFTSQGIIGNMFFVWSPLRKPPSSPRNYCTRNHVLFRSQPKNINSPVCAPIDRASGLPTIWKTTLVWNKMPPFNLCRATVSPGRVGAPYHGGSSAARRQQGRLLLPHAWCNSSPCPQGCARGWGQALPSLQAPVLGCDAVESSGRPWRGVKKIPRHHPLPRLCRPSGVAGGQRGCPAPRLSVEAPHLHQRATAGPHVQNSSSLVWNRPILSTLRTCCNAHLFSQTEKNWENSGRRSQRLEISFHLLGYDLC